MRPPKKLLSELTNDNAPYTVKVKIIDKSRPKVSPPRKTKYQQLTPKDNEGNRMKAMLVNDDVDAYNDVIRYNKEYEISNAPIRPVDPAYAVGGSDFQMGFNNRTVITPLCGEEGDDLENTWYDYKSIVAIKRGSANSDDRLDLLAIPIFMEETRHVPGSNGNTVPVREIVLTDHSTDQPIIVSAWNDLATGDCDKIEDLINSSSVIGITALSPSTHKGFSLATSMSTMIILKSKSEKANPLRMWATANEPLLTQRNERVEQAANTLQDERHALLVKLDNFQKTQIRPFYACNNCGRASNKPAKEVFDCERCNKTDCISSPKLTFNFDAMDSSGAMSYVAYDKIAEDMLGNTADQLCKMKDSDLQKFYAKKAKGIDKKVFKLIVGPTTSLSTIRVLKWVLKSAVPAEVE